MDAIYKLSVVLNMVDNISTPIKNSQNNINSAITKLENMSGVFGDITQTGALLSGMGVAIMEGVLAPVQATFATKRALGELASLGVQDLEMLEAAAQSFSNTWTGTQKADFITAAYDIKSGIASLTDEGIARYTELAGITATATKSTISTMTDLFATGYGIYKNFYGHLSDIQFAEIFSAGLAESVKNFKTTGSEMASSIRTLGAAATTAQVPLQEQLSILGMLQATMSGSEAGTKYKAFLRSAAKGGQELGLNFMDANNQLLSMPEILELLQGKFGETMDAAEKLELQKAFGDQEAVALIDLMYSKTGELTNNINTLYGAMGQGEQAAIDMAQAINATDPAQWDLVKQKMQNLAETLGNTITPTIQEGMAKIGDIIDKITTWISENEELAGMLMKVVLFLGLFLVVGGGLITIVGGIGLVFTKSATMALSLVSVFTKLGGKGSAVLGTIKSFTVGLVGMAKQAIITAITAMPGLIATVWSFTAALLANPVTWIVIGIVALIAALIALWQNWDAVVNFLGSAWNGFVGGIMAGIDWIKDKISGLAAPFQQIIEVIGFLINLPAYVVQNWGSIVDFFKGLAGKWAEHFQAGIQRIKDIFMGIPEWFKDIGGKIISFFTDGIKAAFSAPVNAVKGVLQKIRNLLPFSDAKEGPLDSLTLSGNRVMETLSTGIEQAEDLPAEAVDKGFEQIDLSASRFKGKNIQTDTAKNNADHTDAEARAPFKKTVIEKFILNVDLKQIEEIPKLLKLLEELEDYTNTKDTEMDSDFPEDIIFV